MNFTFNSENYGTTVEVTFEAVTLNEIEDMFKQFLRGSGFYLVEDDMSTKEQNSDTSEEFVPQTDKVPWDTLDMAHRSGGLTVEQNEWVGLTDEEIAQTVGSPIDEVYLSDFRNVEAKLKERNNG
jgi:predicted KAP-like P-loop ATPase